MLSHVESWRQSGLTQRVYCNQVGIRSGTFSYWVQIGKRQELDSGHGRSFVELKKPVSTVGGRYEITYPNGVSLALETADLRELSALINLY